MGRAQYIGDQWRGNTIQYSYDAASNVTQRTTLLNNTSITYAARDALNRLPRRDVNVSGTSIAYESYGYDDAVHVSRLVTVDREDGKRDSFGYDLASEMTSALYGWNANRTVNYTLDLIGNRTQVTDTTAATQTFNPNIINQEVATGTTPAITYGTEHEIASYQNVAYQYINDGRLTHVTSGSNVYDIKYDALGRAVIRILNGATTFYYYDGEKPILEQGANSASNIYGLGIDEVVIRFTPADVFYFYQDHEGSVTHVRNNAGVMIETYRYDAFGLPYVNGGNGHTSVINNRFMFTGREYNNTFGYYEYRTRAYHPGLGRFMSEDPKLYDAGDYNLYRYCGNDPEDRVDPMGLEDFRISPGSMAAQHWLPNGTGATGESAPTSNQAGGKSDAPAVEDQTTSQVPRMTREEAIRRYGEYKSGKEDRYLTTYRVPEKILKDPAYNMRWDRQIEGKGGQLVTDFRVNKDLVAGVSKALENLQRGGHLGDLKEFGGAFFPRTTRGSDKISAHAYGLALDINSSANPRGQPSHQTPELRAAFVKAGFHDGGTWDNVHTPTDGMHFSVGF